MSTIRLRPRISRVSALPPAEVRRRIEQRLDDPGCPVEGRVFNSSAVLRTPPSERHFWSPHFEVGFEEAPDGGSYLSGIFGPRPAVWSILVAAYAAIGFLGVMGVTFGFSQWMLGYPPWVLWSGPVAALLALAVYGVARVGRRLGYDQMVVQLSWIEDVTDAVIPERAGASDDRQAVAT